MNSTSSAPSASPSPSSSTGPVSAPPEGAAPPRAPRSAVVLGIVSVALLATFTAVRIVAATKAKREASAKLEPAAQVQAERAEAPPAVVRGTPVAWTPAIACEGTLAPARDVDLAFEASGRLAAVRVKAGDHVKRGEVLATLDTVEAAAQVQAAAAQVRAAEAQLALADDAERRVRGMVDAGAAPEANGVQVVQQRALAVAQLDGARAQLALARAALGNHTLAAPFAGFVTRVPSGTGGIAAAGVPLFHLSDSSTLKLQGTVSDADAPLVTTGSDVEIVAQGRTLRAKLAAVLSSVDPQTRRVPIEAEAQNDDAAPFLAGTFVRARIFGKEPIPVLRLPATTLRPGSQDELMIVSGGRMHARHVAFARDADGSLLVRTGLDANEDVLAAPASNATDGAELYAEAKK